MIAQDKETMNNEGHSTIVFSSVNESQSRTFWLFNGSRIKFELRQNPRFMCKNFKYCTIFSGKTEECIIFSKQSVWYGSASTPATYDIQKIKQQL